MPPLYEKIRDQYVAKGKPYDKAQAIAAATYRKLTGKDPRHPEKNTTEKR